MREVLCRLKDAGFALIVVSNQPDVARGTTSRETVEAINRRLAATLPIDEFRSVSTTTTTSAIVANPSPDIARRRPRTGDRSLCKLHDRRPLARRRSGAAAGCRTIFIDYGYDEQRHVRLPCHVAAARRQGSSVRRNGMRDGANDESHRSTEGEDLRRWRGQGRNAGDVCKAVHQGAHYEPDIDAQGRNRDYRAFAKDILAEIPDRPISFEVFSDDFADMERQALEIAGWGENVYVKIPVTNTRREPTLRTRARSLPARG